MKIKSIIGMGIFLFLSLFISGCTTLGEVSINRNVITQRETIDMKITLQGYYIVPTNLTIKFITEDYLFVTRPNEITELKTDNVNNILADSRELNYEIRSRTYYGYTPTVENVIILIYEEGKPRITKLASDFIEIRRN